MRFILLTLLFLVTTTSPVTQSSAENPFEIPSRLPDPERQVIDQRTALQPTNPFDKRTGGGGPAVGEIDADAGVQGPLIIRRGDEADFLDARGRTLGIHILLLFLTALLWIFFRPDLSRYYSALLNEGLFSQLYRRRESGRSGIFFICYTLFFLAGGFSIYLIGQAFDWLPSDQPWTLWFYFVGALLGLILTKHLVLSVIGWLFPVTNEIRKYSFVIMIFGIALSMFLVPYNLLISYAPKDYTLLITKAGLLLIGAFYLFRAFRSILMNNRFLDGNLLHFLLYICAVEIAPVFVLAHYLAG